LSVVIVSGLTKSFGDHNVLDGLDLAVPEGSLTAVLGPSGSGKTTLLRLLAGIEHADSGSITIGAEKVDDGSRRGFVPPKRRHIGYVPQEGALFPHLTVAKNISFGLRRGTDRNRHVAELIGVVGLDGLDHRYPHQLSGGQQQRVALARALAIEPALVLLDEPFSWLDPGLRSSIRTDVRRILKETGSTTVLVTHDQDEALSCADFVAVIRSGRIVQSSTPRDIYARPFDAGTALFVGGVNLIEGIVTGATVATAFGSLSLLPPAPPLTDGTAVVVLVRPEQIRVSTPDERAGPWHTSAMSPDISASGSCNGLPGCIADVQFYGHDLVINVTPDKPCGTEMVVARAGNGLAVGIGSPVILSVSEPVHVWRA
jgi:iron(III) transport system ATP-binding protein